MNHDFLLKTETPVAPVQGAKKQPFSNNENEAKAELKQAFSSELGKQIDKQEPVNKVSEKSEVAAGSVESPAPTSSEKAEVALDENGKPLPTEDEIAENFVTQLLSDIDGDPELKQELTRLIQQFVNTTLNEEAPEQSLEKSLVTLVSQLVKAGLGKNEAGDEQSTSKLANKDNAVVLKETTQATINALLGTTTAKQADDTSAERVIGQKTALANQVSAVLNPPSQKSDQLERVQSVLQYIRDVVTKEIGPGSEQKSDKVALIAELVKKIVPEKSQPAAQTALRTQLPDAAAPSQLTQLRPDILQALPNKPLGSTITTLNPNVAEITPLGNAKTDIINLDDKRAERIIQLVDLLKPAKVDEQQLRPVNFDKAAPTAVTNTPTTTLATASKAALPSLDIQPSIQSKAWSRVLSSRVVWMASEGVQQATLRLNPANLGPVEVRLHVQNEQANVTFIAQNAATRDALEQALPRLRESFVENGLDLADADVSDQASHETNEDEARNNKDDQNGDVIATSGSEQGAEQSGTDAKSNGELGVNVYA